MMMMWVNKGHGDYLPRRGAPKTHGISTQLSIIIITITMIQGKWFQNLHHVVLINKIYTDVAGSDLPHAVICGSVICCLSRRVWCYLNVARCGFGIFNMIAGLRLIELNQKKFLNASCSKKYDITQTMLDGRDVVSGQPMEEGSAHLMQGELCQEEGCNYTQTKLILVRRLNV
jgi:hypothetical protein